MDIAPQACLQGHVAVYGVVMWLLVATICLRLDATSAECRRDVQGPYSEPMTCRDRMEPQGRAVESLARDIGARVLFVSVACVKGQDT